MENELIDEYFSQVNSDYDSEYNDYTDHSQHADSSSVDW